MLTLVHAGQTAAARLLVTPVIFISVPGSATLIMATFFITLFTSLVVFERRTWAHSRGWEQGRVVSKHSLCDSCGSQPMATRSTATSGFSAPPFAPFGSCKQSPGRTP